MLKLILQYRYMITKYDQLSQEFLILEYDSNTPFLEIQQITSIKINRSMMSGGKRSGNMQQSAQGQGGWQYDSK